MSDDVAARGEAHGGRLRAVAASLVSVLRGSLLLVSSRPGTPLRVLCVVAFDTLYALRSRRRLPMHRLRAVAGLLDLGACVNRFFDGKGFSRGEYRATRELARQAGADGLVEAYLRRLRRVEGGRPVPGGGRLCYEQTRAYREAVVRLSLECITALVFDAESMEMGAGVFGGDDDFEVLFRIVMLCQLADDVLDRRADARSGLPSLMTATASVSEAHALNGRALASYRDVGGLSPSRSAFPFRVALFVVWACTRVVLGVSRRWSG